MNGDWSDLLKNEFLVTGTVFDVEYLNGTAILLGGAFRRVGNITNLNNIALLSYPELKWLPTIGVKGIVTSFVSFYDTVFVGGHFIACVNETVCVNNIIGWNTALKDSIYFLGNGLPTSPPQSTTKHAFVTSLASANDNLYIGGNFIQVLFLPNISFSFFIIIFN